MKRILMTLLCLVGLTGLADMYEFDKTKFAFAEGFNGGTLVQDKLLLQITSGDQLAYFKQGDKRPDGHIIGAGEEGFYAGFTMGWNYTTTAYATPDHARFSFRGTLYSGETEYSGEDVQNGRAPGLSIATKTALATYVTSFTYWAKIDPTKLVQDQVYTLPLTVWSLRHKILGVEQPYWTDATFTIQVLVGKEFVLKTPDGEQVFPAVTRLFEKIKADHVAEYENEIFCGGIQKAYEQAVQMAEARAKTEGRPFGQVEAYITMETDGTLDPNLIIAPRAGRIFINLNGHHLTLVHSLPNAGCAYEFRDTQGTGSVDCKETYILSENRVPNEGKTISKLAIRGGTFKNELADPGMSDAGTVVIVFGGTFEGKKTGAILGEGGWLYKHSEYDTEKRTAIAHVHSWTKLDGDKAREIFGANYDAKGNSMAVVCCDAGNCPYDGEMFVIRLASEDFGKEKQGAIDHLSHHYPCNVRFFNGRETRLFIAQDTQIESYGQQSAKPSMKPADKRPDFFAEAVGQECRDYATSVSAVECMGAWWNGDEGYRPRPDDELYPLIAMVHDAVLDYNEIVQEAMLNANAVEIDYPKIYKTLISSRMEIAKMTYEMAQIELADIPGEEKDALLADMKKKMAEIENEFKVFWDAFVQKTKFQGTVEDLLLRPLFTAQRRANEKMGDAIAEAKAKLHEIMNTDAAIGDARIFNPARYDLSGELRFDNLNSPVPSEQVIAFSDTYDVLPVPLDGTVPESRVKQPPTEFYFSNLKFAEPYIGEKIEKRISDVLCSVNASLSSDGAVEACRVILPYGYEWDYHDEVETSYFMRGLELGADSKTSATKPGEYMLTFQANHDYRMDRLGRDPESARGSSEWSDPFIGGTTVSWTILDGPVMVMDNDHDEAPYMSLQEAAADLEDEDVTARITQDLLNDGRAENVVVPEKYGFLDLGTCGTFTLDLCGHMIGAEAEPGAFTCIVNDGTMVIVDTMKFGAAKLDDKQVLLQNKQLVPGTVYGQVVNNGTMTIGAEPLRLKAGSLGRRFMPSPIFRDAVSNSGTMTIYSGTFERDLVNVAGTIEIRGGSFEGPIVDDAEGVTLYGGMFNKNYVTFEELEARIALGYQVVDEGDYYAVILHRHAYELEVNRSGFTLTCTNDPICLVREGAFTLKKPEAVNKDYDREPLDAAPYVCTILDESTGEKKEVSQAAFTNAFEGILTVSKPFEYLYLKEPVESAVNAGKYDSGISFIASNVFIRAKGAVADEYKFGCGETYEIAPVQLTSVELDAYEFDYNGEMQGVGAKSVYAGSLLLNDEFQFGRECVVEAVGSPFEVCEYPFIVVGKEPNTYGAVTNYWRILPPSGNFAGNAATEAQMGNEPCGYVDGNPEEGFSLFVTDPQNMVYEASTRTWLTGLTVAWPYKTALLAKDRKYTPAEDAYFLCSTDPTNVLTAADILFGLDPAGARMDAETGKDGISDVPGVKKFTWWVEISADDARKAKTAYETVQAEDGAYDNLKQNGEAIAQQLVNAKTICAFIAEGIEKDALFQFNKGNPARALEVLRMVRERVSDQPFEDVTPEVISNHMAVVTSFAEYIATGDEALYDATMKKWVEVFGKDSWQPTDQKMVQEIMNRWASNCKFWDEEAKKDLFLTDDVRYEGGIMPVCARNLYIVENFDHVTYTLTAWGLAGAHDEDGVKATDFKVVIPSGDFVLVEDDLADAEVALEGDESFIAEKAAYKFDRKEHSVTVPETIKLGVNWLTKGEDFEVVGEGVSETGSPFEDCKYCVTLKALPNRGITGTKVLAWYITAPSGSFGTATIANGATGEFTANYELTFGDYALDNNGLVYYTEEEAKAAGLSGEGWYAAMKVVVPVDGVDFMKPSILYFTANGSGFTANSCKDAINEHGVTSEVTEDISTWWYPCVRSFTWWTKVTVDAVKAAEDAGNTAITNTISAYGLAWEGSSDLIDLGSAGIRAQEFRVVINTKMDEAAIKLRDHDNIQYWPVHDHNYAYKLADGTNLTAKCYLPDCPMPEVCMSLLVEPLVKTFDQQPVEAELVNERAFGFYTKSNIGAIEYYNANGSKFVGTGAPVNTGVYTAKVEVVSKTDAGKTIVTNVLSEGFAILPAGGEVEVTLNPTTAFYTGREQKTAATVTIGDLVLKEGRDYEIDGLSQVGSGVSNETYEVTVRPSATGNVDFAPTNAFWTIKGPSGGFPAPAKAAGSEQGSLDGTKLAFYTDPETAKTVANSGLAYYTAENAPDQSGIAGWYAGIKVSVPYTATDFTKTSAMLFNYTNELFTAEDCPMNGVLVETDKFDYPYVKGFTWWTRFEVADFEKAMDEAKKANGVQAKIVRTLKATGLPWSGKSLAVLDVGSAGLKETAYAIELTFDEGQRYYDDEGHQLYPQHDHEYRFSLGEKGSCLTVACQKPSDCSYPQMKMWLRNESDTYVGEYNGQPFELFLVTSNTSDQVWREISYESFMDYTGAWLGEKDTYYVGVKGTDYPKTLEAPTAVGNYYAQAAVVHWKDAEQTVPATNLLTRMFGIVAKPIQACAVALSDTSFQWDGKLHSVGIRGVYNGALELTEGVDYEIDYENSVFEEYGEEGEDRAYPVIIKAIEPNYTGVSTNWWTITTGEGYYYDVLNPDEKAYASPLQNVLNRASVKSPIDAYLGKSYRTEQTTTVAADIVGRTKVLDLNGKTVFHDPNVQKPFLVNEGILTITDTVGCGMLSNRNSSAVLIENTGTLNIEAGTYYGKIVNTGDLTIEDGLFTGDLVADGLGKLTITGGTFDGEITKKDLLAKVEISGGVFTSDPGDHLKAGYVADFNGDDRLWHVTKHVHAYTYQQIPAEGAVLTGECFTNATKRIACDERVVKAELVAENQPYTGVPYVAELAFSVKDSVLSTEWKPLTKTQYVELTGAVIDEIVYSMNGAKMDWEDVVKPSADYKAEVKITVTNTAAITGAKTEKTFTLGKKFTIGKADFEEVEIVTDPDLETSDEFTYTGDDIAIEVAAYLGGVELVEGEDYTVEGVVSTNRIGTYAFTVKPDESCFKAGEPKTFTWSIVEPDGEFAADALSAAVADGAPAYAEVVEGTNLVITASTNLWYDAEAKCWLAGFEIKWPYDTEQILRAPTYTDPEHAMVEFSTTNGVFSIADIAEGKVEVAGFDAAADSFYRIKHGRDETYVTGVEWIVPFTFEAVTNAIEQGEEELSYEISVMSPAWENNPGGLRRTTYKITLPLDENLVLWDEMGRQRFPVHAHEWACELFADDGAVTNRLTATCGAADCPQGSVTVALGSEAGTDKEYDGQPLAATLVGAEEFAVHTGAKLGSVNYETEDGIAVNGVPVDAGVYFAKATVTMPDETAYTLKLRLVIGERNLYWGYIELKGGSAYDYTGREIDVDEQAMKVNYLGQTLVRDKDYTVDAESVFAATGSGVSNTTYKITVEGQGNYTNTLSFYWTIYAPEGDFGRTEKASDELGGEFADETTLVFEDAGEVNYGLKYYTADNAPDGSGVAGWYAGVKVTVPCTTFEFLRPEDMFFRDVDLDESFSGESCPYDGVSLTAGQAIYKYVTAFTWWTRITAEDVTGAEGEDIVRTLKATGLAWSDALKAVGSEGLAETDYQIVVKTEGLVLFDDRGVQIYPHHDHIWSYEAVENAIRATCSAEDCPVVACELNFPSVVHEQALGTTAADDTELLGAATFRLHVGAEFGEFRFFDLAGEEIAAPSLVGEYLAAVDVMLPEQDGSVLTNTLETTVSVVKTEGADFDDDALAPYDFKDGNEGGYGEVEDGTNVVVTDSTKLAYDPATATWYAGVFVKMPNGYYGGDLFANQIKDESTFLSVSTAEGVHYVDKIAAGEALEDELLEITDKHSTGIFFPGVDYLDSIAWKTPLTLEDVMAAHEAGQTEIVRTITIGANSRASSEDPFDWGSSKGVVPTAFTLTIPLEDLVLVDENGETVWPTALKVEPSGTVTYPKAVKGSEFLKEKASATWKAKAALGSVFGHWEWVGTNGPAPAAFLALSENERKKATLTFKVAAGEKVRPKDFAAVWYRIDEDTFGQVTLTPSNLVTESKSYVTAKVTGLPTGMKFTAKSLKITGAPKKVQTKTVKISLKNASGYTFKQSYLLTVNPDLTVALTPAEDQTKTGTAVLTWCDTTLGKATGSKVYTAGKKASIKATPAKGSIFLGWYEDIMLTKPATWLPKGYLTASQSVVVPAEGLELFARYVKLEAWTVGTFDGVYLEPDPVAEISAPEGKVTLTVSSTGKVSGKTMFGGKTYSFKSTAFDDYLVENGVGYFTAHVTESTLKRALTIRVWCDGKTGLGNAKIDYGTLENAPWAMAVQNGWKLKVLPKFPTGKSALTPLEADGLKFKFNANGAVAVSGKLAGTTVSAAQTSQLLPSEIAVPDMDGAPVTMYADICVYVAPKTKSLPLGFCKIYPVKLTYRNGVFESVSFDEVEE